ncbi:hypothetical protein Aduo_010585 [Ancylostoma duodenale]
MPVSEASCALQIAQKAMRLCKLWDGAEEKEEKLADSDGLYEIGLELVVDMVNPIGNSGETENGFGVDLTNFGVTFESSAE